MAKQTGLEPFFTEIGMVKEIMRYADHALKVLNPVLVIGGAGCGKTQSLLHLHNIIERSCYSAVSPADKSPLGMVKMLHRAMGYREQARHHRDVRDAVISDLRFKNQIPVDPKDAQPRFIILVDEVQNLEPKAMKDMLDIAIDTGSAMVMAGNVEELARGKSGQQKTSISESQQITSRYGAIVRVLPPSNSDLTSIAAKPEFKLEGMDAYRAAVNYGRKKSIREMVTLLNMARSIASDSSTVHLHHLNEAVVLVNGYQKNSQQLLKGKVA